MKIIAIVLCSVVLVFSLYKVFTFNEAPKPEVEKTEVEKPEVEKPKTREVTKVEPTGSDFWYKLGQEGAKNGTSTKFIGVSPEFVEAYRKGEEDYRRSQ